MNLLWSLSIFPLTSIRTTVKPAPSLSVWSRSLRGGKEINGLVLISGLWQFRYLSICQKEEEGEGRKGERKESYWPTTGKTSRHTFRKACVLTPPFPSSISPTCCNRVENTLEVFAAMLPCSKSQPVRQSKEREREREREKVKVKERRRENGCLLWISSSRLCEAPRWNKNSVAWPMGVAPLYASRKRTLYEKRGKSTRFDSLSDICGNVLEMFLLKNLLVDSMSQS